VKVEEPAKEMRKNLPAGSKAQVLACLGSMTPWVKVGGDWKQGGEKGWEGERERERERERVSERDGWTHQWYANSLPLE
jgi:hypothetical protein